MMQILILYLTEIILGAAIVAWIGAVVVTGVVCVDARWQIIQHIIIEMLEA